MIDRSSRLLERALLFSFVIHGIAMLSMALLLLPGMPGGGTADDVARVQYIAAHPWLWRLGWLPWQLTALSDVLIAAGLLRASWVPKSASVITALVTLAAVVPDQLGQIAWITRGIALAESGDTSAYLAFETRIFAWTAVWGGTLYTLGAIGWTACLVAGRTFSRGLTMISLVLWPLFLYVNAGPLLPEPMRPSSAFVAAGNAVGFVLLEVWLVLAAEMVMRRARPDAAWGRLSPWHHPHAALRHLLDPIANSRFVRAVAEFAPLPAFVSDITDVIYVNYVVDAALLEPLVPAGLELQRIGPEKRHAIFTFLSFRHGHFGPRLLGPLRRLLPSPIQTNWRIHVRDPRHGREGVYFVTTAIANTFNALGARLMAEGMPMHVLAEAELRSEHGCFILKLEPGVGSAPDAEAALRPAATAPASGPWCAAFGSWRVMLSYIVPQDRALSTQPWCGHITRQEIRLDIPIDCCEPLEGEVSSRAAAAYVGDAEPFCFRVASVKFRFDSEAYDSMV
jgi:hypothetical protein